MRLNAKTSFQNSLELRSPSSSQLGPDSAVRIRLNCKTSPQAITIREPQRHRSAAITHLEEMDAFSDDEDSSEVQLSPHTDPDILNAIGHEEVWEALNWQAAEAEPAGYDDPFEHGVSLG